MALPTLSRPSSPASQRRYVECIRATQNGETTLTRTCYFDVHWADDYLACQEIARTQTGGPVTCMAGRLLILFKLAPQLILLTLSQERFRLNFKHLAVEDRVMGPRF